MKLISKIIIVVSIIVTSIISIMFFVLSNHFQRQIDNHLLTTARIVFKNIVLVRKWVADKEGIFHIKQAGDKANPFLAHPEIITNNNDTLLMKNPALVTRELSELSYTMGENFSFHLASLKYINPLNKPDDFEEKALNFLENPTSNNLNNEFFRSESINNQHYFRYFAPLYTEKSCLTCHAQHGYKLGDVRGGISIILATDEHKKAKNKHLIFFLLTGFFSILTLSIPIIIAIKRSVIQPLKDIEYAAEKIQTGKYDYKLSLNSDDEIGTLAKAFDAMRIEIKDFTGKLQSSENKYREINEHSFDAIAIIDSDGHIVDCNSKMRNLTGYKSKELKSLNFNKLIDNQAKRVMHSNSPAETKTEHFETIFISAGQIEIPVELYIIKGFSLDSVKGLSFIYMRDLSERKKIEQYSIQTEKMFALGQVSAGIAHEIRNPIFAINNNLDYLHDKCPDNGSFKELYPELKESVARIQKLVSAILDYAKPHDLSFKEIDITEVIQGSLILVQKQFEKSSIKINTQFSHSDKLITADAHKLEQVFVNLFLNAFQAMPNAGILTISTIEQDNHVTVKINDTGMGIPAEDIKRIFDPFYTKTTNGTGLGMAIVQRILDQHNAHYWIKSEVDLGTTFYILFHIKRSI